MIVRTWTTKFDVRRRHELDTFADTVSLPMLRRQPAFRGAVFAASGDDYLVITFWRDREAVDRLNASEEYRDTVGRIIKAGFLAGDQEVGEYERTGGDLHRE